MIIRVFFGFILISLGVLFLFFVWLGGACALSADKSGNAQAFNDMIPLLLALLGIGVGLIVGGLKLIFTRSKDKSEKAEIENAEKQLRDAAPKDSENKDKP